MDGELSVLRVEARREGQRSRAICPGQTRVYGGEDPLGREELRDRLLKGERSLGSDRLWDKMHHRILLRGYLLQQRVEEWPPLRSPPRSGGQRPQGEGRHRETDPHG